MREIFPLLFIVFCSAASASTIFLSPEGDDVNGNGSAEHPWFTLERGWASVSAGDTIFMFSGTYAFTTRQDLTGKNGTSGKKISIMAFPGEKPVITRAGTFNVEAQTNLIHIDSDFLYIKDLEISHFKQTPGVRASSALFCYTSNSIFENLDYHHNSSGMVIRGSSTNNLILNCDFHNNYDPYAADPYHHADGLDIAEIPSGTVNTVRGCRFYYNADDGLDLWNNAGSVIVENCWAWKNGYREDGVTTGGDGAGFKLGQTLVSNYTSCNRTLNNNISVSNRMFGITQNGALCKMSICNNIVYGNKHMGLYFSASWGDAAHVIRNNIAYNNAKDAGIGIKLPVIDHNSWQMNSAVSDEDFVSTDWTQLARARKADGGLPDIDFMHLASGSDLIDAGADVGLPFRGAAPDIGAFEISTGESNLNQLPFVSISSPVKGISFTTPATVIIDIEANDPDGNITKVELFNGTVKLDERTAAPYSFTLKELPEGSYALKAVATDNLKASSSSSTLDLTVTSYIEARDYFNLYPNPNDGRFSIDFTTLLDADIFSVTVVDLIGKTVYREDLLKDESTRQFDLSHLKNGIYILMISANQILLTQKFIKG